MSSPIGLIGLGAMGRGMAGSLRRAGYAVHVFDVRPEAVQAFTADGGTGCTQPGRPGRALRHRGQRGGQRGADRSRCCSAPTVRRRR